LKATWGPLSYLIGTVKALPDLSDFETYIGWDDEAPERIDALNVVVANGRTAGGGQPAAPRANPEDGLLDVVIVRDCTGVELAGLAARALTGDYLDSEHVLFRRVRRLRVESRPGMWFNVDGELHTNEPVSFEVMPGALHVAVGPSYRPEPEL
jgi:diacylglycerol kinase (ATP)